jgi:NADH:ubiquinone oxidoreductase subunit F (NADH-binding)
MIADPHVPAAARVHPPVGIPRLLAGPPASAGPESFESHRARLGPRPTAVGPAGGVLMDALDRALLRGRGGAGFPAGRKWRSVAANAQAAGGRAVVVANGAEGEPAAAKDRVLMALRPHLVIDGALLAAEAVGAADAVVYLPRTFPEARAALEHALRERRLAGEDERWVRVVSGPHRYVAGEESAVASYLNGGDARPTFVPPRPYQRGVGRVPTLVQNVETLAHAALIARFGEAWFRAVGTPASPGSVLLTLSGAVARPGVYEVAQGTPLGTAVGMAGDPTETPQAVLVGGYSGRWVAADAAYGMQLDAQAMAAAGTPLGAAVIAVLPQSACGVHETDAALEFLARESARQCGPCLHGLDAIAATFHAAARGRGRPSDLERLTRWAAEIAGRGACHHPDGAVVLLQSALRVFGPQLNAHLRRGACEACARPPLLPMPRLEERWR